MKDTYDPVEPDPEIDEAFQAAVAAGWTPEVPVAARRKLYPKIPKLRNVTH